MKTNNDAIVGCLGVLFGAIVLMVLSSLLGGYVLAQLWTWFIVPVFGLPQLNIAQAIGLTMVVTFLTAHSTKSDKDKDTSFGEWLIISFVYVIVKAALYLFIGSIVASYIQGG